MKAALSKDQIIVAYQEAEQVETAPIRSAEVDAIRIECLKHVVFPPNFFQFNSDRLKMQLYVGQNWLNRLGL